jgi:hypothetical protein
VLDEAVPLPSLAVGTVPLARLEAFRLVMAEPLPENVPENVPDTVPEKEAEVPESAPVRVPPESLR